MALTIISGVRFHAFIPPPYSQNSQSHYLTTEIGIRGLLPLSLQAKLLCLQQRADEADRSIQWKITHWSCFYVKPEVNCNNND